MVIINDLINVSLCRDDTEAIRFLFFIIIYKKAV